MKRHNVALALAASLMLLVSALASAGPLQARISATYTLPDIGIAAAQNAALPNSVANDRKLLLGGISDLWRSSKDPANEFYVTTDRGPNGQIAVGTETRRTFPIPEFTPLILKIRVEGSAIRILETIAIVGQSGKPVTGLPNLDKIDEVPYDFSAQTVLKLNPSGLDTEGLVRTSAGDFWLVEEYSPSLLKVDAKGKVVKRFVPEGLKLESADYPVSATLPAIYTKRKGNRGFEGLGISADEKTLYIALQSPLSNPTSAVGNPSRNTRVLVFDIASEKATAEYVYRHEAIGEFDATPNAAPTEMKVSGIIAYNASTLLVLERTDVVAKVYAVDMTRATNILTTKWSNLATAPSLESLADPSSEGITVLPKRLVVDLNKLPGMPGKIEGVAVVDKTTLAVTNDNDFDINTFDASGNHVGKGAKSQLLIVSDVALDTPATLPASGAEPRLPVELVLAGAALILLAWRLRSASQ